MFVGNSTLQFAHIYSFDGAVNKLLPPIAPGRQLEITSDQAWRGVQRANPGLVAADDAPDKYVGLIYAEAALDSAVLTPVRREGWVSPPQREKKYPA